MVLGWIEVYAHREVRFRNLGLGLWAEYVGITTVVNVFLNDGFQLVAAKQSGLRAKRTTKSRLRTIFASFNLELVDVGAAHLHEQLVSTELHYAELGRWKEKRLVVC